MPFSDCLKIFSLKSQLSYEGIEKRPEETGSFRPQYLGDGKSQILEVRYQICQTFQHVSKFGWFPFGQLQGSCWKKTKNKQHSKNIRLTTTWEGLMKTVFYIAP